MAPICEHGIRQIDCPECRYELGVVKVDPDLANRMLTEFRVASAAQEPRELELRCQVEANATRSTSVTALVRGRVSKVLRSLGDTVSEGEVLAEVHSDAIGEARLRHREAHLARELARAELARLLGVQENLRQLVARLQGAGGNEIGEGIESLAIGERKGPLVSAYNSWWAAKTEWERETLRFESALKLAGLVRGGGDPGKTGRLVVGEWKDVLLQARADVTLAKKVLERERTLVEKGVSARNELDRAERDHHAARARLDAAIEKVELEVAYGKTELQLKLSSARATLLGELEQASLDLEIERMKAEQQVERTAAEAAVTHRSLALFGYQEEEFESLPDGDTEDFGRLEVRSPGNGTVVGLEISAGMVVEEGRPMFTLTDTREPWIWCHIYQRDLEELLRAGLPVPANVTSGAFPDAVFPGSLDYVEHSADARTRTVRARIVLVDEGRRLRPGMFVTARVVVSHGKAGLPLPRDAVLSDEGKEFVFVKWNGDFWVRRFVETDGDDADRISVVSGLAPGDIVAVKGAFFLKGEVLKEKMGAGCAD